MRGPCQENLTPQPHTTNAKGSSNDAPQCVGLSQENQPLQQQTNMSTQPQQANIRTATSADFAAIRAVVHEVWPVAYREMITPEQISYMLEWMYSDESLQKQIAEEGCIFLLYESNGIVLGFASFSEIEPSLFKLHKLYVYTQWQGKGIGKALLDEVKKRATQRGGQAIELQVNKKNIAQHFYLKQGFSIDRELVLDIGEGFVMDDYVMKALLSAGY